MPLTGTLRTWDDARGFGFIAPTHGGPQVFVHISAFPGDGTRPTVGERLSYELGRGRDGKPQAVKVVRQAIGRSDGARKPSGRPAAAPRTSVANWIGWLAVLGVVGAAVAYGYQRIAESQHRRTLASQPAAPLGVKARTGAYRPFECDGRTHCSQMTSCAEATWFINHCPGTRMDSDNDGVPCEQQRCTGAFGN